MARDVAERPEWDPQWVRARDRRGCNLARLGPGLYEAEQTWKEPSGDADPKLWPHGKVSMTNRYLFRQNENRSRTMLASHYWFQPLGAAKGESPAAASGTLLERPVRVKILKVEDLPTYVWMENKFPGFDRALRG